MRTFTPFPFISLLLFTVFGCAPAAAEYLYLSPERIAEIKQLKQTPGTHEKAAFDSMKARVNHPDVLQAYPTGGGGKYEPGFRAREAALISLLASDPSESRKYADIAYQMAKKAIAGDIDQSHNQRGKLVSMKTGYGLARAIIGMNVAITYNWMQNTWNDQEKAFVKQALDEALNAWPRYSHANFGESRASNWVAVCRGGELVMILASGDKEKRSGRVSALKRELMKHLNAGFGDLGVAQEGAGYTEYPGQFLLPAIYGMAELGDEELLARARSIEWWKMVMYAYTFQPQSIAPGDRKFLQWGVATRGPHEGWVSLLLNLVPKDQLPYYLWFYDRYIGRQSPFKDEGLRYDCHRAGTTWSLIYYPSGLQAKDPTDVFPKAVKDSRGFAFFRNRWRDANDIQILAMADEVHHGKAWDKADNLGLRLMAYHSGFFNGPGKFNGTENFSTLLVDGKFAPRRSRASSKTGKMVAFEPNKSGGTFIADGGSLYSSLGVDQAKRQTAVFFAPAKFNSGIISTLDQLRSRTPHSYTWQANLRMPSAESTLSVTTGQESGVNTFTIKGERGYVKGWVMYPDDVEISAGEALKITTRSENADIWVVMLASENKPSAAEVTGSGLQRRWRMGSKSVKYNAQTDRIEIR